MQKIKFNNSDRIFDVALSAYEKNRIKCVFYSSIDINNAKFLKSGFKELNERNLKVQGNHNKMRYIYQQLNDHTIIFTSHADDVYQNIE